MSFSKPGSFRTVTYLVLCCCALLICSLGLAADPILLRPQRVGEVEPIEIEMGRSGDTFLEQLVWYPDASYIKLHLIEFELAPGVELTVSDHEETVVHRYPGARFTTDGNPGRWALSVPGDTAELRLQVVDPELAVDLRDSWVRIDQMAWGYPLGQVGGPEGICGADDRRDVECYSASHPTEFERSRAVARLLINNAFLCTGWRVGPGPHMFTNEHCVSTQAQVTGTELWFNWERPGCETGSTKPITVTTGDTLLLDIPVLDFALFTISDPGLVAPFGYLELDPRLPVLGEEIYMAGHPDGNRKIFALESDFNPGGLCAVDIAVCNGLGPNTDTCYYCDSTGGQSGSPVLARSSHKVIALHHLGSTIPCNAVAMNSGVRIDRIWPFVENYLGFSFEDGFESGDLSGWSSAVP